jgi:hypothetical protein
MVSEEDDFNEGDATQNAIEIGAEIIISDEEESIDRAAKYVKHKGCCQKRENGRLAHMEEYYNEKYPEAGFSVVWNQVECMAHVLNLGAQQILKEFKQPVDKETYESGSDSSDNMVTSVSRLSFLCRKIRLAPKLRRLLEKVCNEKDVKFLVNPMTKSPRWLG